MAHAVREMVHSRLAACRESKYVTSKHAHGGIYSMYAENPMAIWPPSCEEAERNNIEQKARR